MILVFYIRARRQIKQRWNIVFFSNYPQKFNSFTPLNIRALKLIVFPLFFFLSLLCLYFVFVSNPSPNLKLWRLHFFVIKILKKHSFPNFLCLIFIFTTFGFNNKPTKILFKQSICHLCLLKLRYPFVLSLSLFWVLFSRVRHSVNCLMKLGILFSLNVKMG